MEQSRPDLVEVHKVLLKMLKAVAVLCDKYNIRYSLYCGTLLGAVRHKGFIPWDHDADLTMPLEDYRRFLKHADELPSDFFCESPVNTPDCETLWARIKANNTTFMRIEYAEVEEHKGVAMDIYPMLGSPKISWLKTAQSRLFFVALRLQRAAHYRFVGDPGWARRVIAHLPDLFRKIVIDAIMRLCVMDTRNSEYIGTLDTAPFEGKFPRKDWEEMKQFPFEDTSFLGPVQFDRILRRIYGDYMKLPPEEKRNEFFEDEMIIDAHRDYRLYCKELLGK